MVKKILFCFVLIGCTSNNDNVETIAIVNNKGFQSEIFIFFGQDTVVGNVTIDNGKHYFNVQNRRQIFFLKENIGDGKIEFYDRKGGELKEVYYRYPMGAKDWKNRDFQVAGGALKEIYNLSKKRKIQYITFKSDYINNLENSWNIRSEKVIDAYRSVNKNDTIITEIQYAPL